MKKSKAESAETRKRIVDVAAHAFKSNGIQATGVAEIMSTLGMTHGGFYRHFDSKEQLVAEACAVNMDDFVVAASDAATNGPESYLQYLQGYLSTENRDNLGDGCPVAALGSELVRSDAEARSAISRGYEQIIDIATQRFPKEDELTARENALFMLPAMLGALTLSRVLDNRELSDQILEVTKKRLRIMFSDGKHEAEATAPQTAPKKNDAVKFVIKTSSRSRRLRNETTQRKKSTLAAA